MRLLLQKTIERNDGLVKINHEVTIAIPTILAAVWGISLKENGISMIPVLCIISIGLLIIWRYYAHYLDDDIAKHYSRILQLEDGLSVSKNCSIFSGLIRSIISPINEKFKDEKTRDEYENSILNLSNTQKINLVQILHEKKRMGYRGHNIWDSVGFFSILCCSTILLYNLFLCPNPGYITDAVKIITPCVSLILIIVLIASIGYGFFRYYEKIGKLLNFHVHPTKEEMDVYITTAKNRALESKEDC